MRGRGLVPRDKGCVGPPGSPQPPAGGTEGRALGCRPRRGGIPAQWACWMPQDSKTSWLRATSHTFLPQSSHQKVRADANLEPCFLVAPSHSSVVFSRSVVSDSCDPMDCSPPGSSVHAIFRARMLEWVALSFSRGSSWPREWTRVSCFAGGFFTTESPGKPRGSHQSIIPFEVFSTLKLFSVHPEEGAVRHTFIPKKH